METTRPRAKNEPDVFAVGTYTLARVFDQKLPDDVTICVRHPIPVADVRRLFAISPSSALHLIDRPQLRLTADFWITTAENQVQTLDQSVPVSKTLDAVAEKLTDDDCTRLLAYAVSYPWDSVATTALEDAFQRFRRLIQESPEDAALLSEKYMNATSGSFLAVLEEKLRGGRS